MAALRRIEEQTGVSFSVLPELLPPELQVSGFRHEGPLRNGLDRLVGPLGLSWELGRFGGIVIHDPHAKRRRNQEWKARTFEICGVRADRLSPHGQRLGLQRGDVVVALNGEPFYDALALKFYVRERVPIGAAIQGNGAGRAEIARSGPLVHVLDLGPTPRPSGALK